jgi:hypothetical protein
MWARVAKTLPPPKPDRLWKRPMMIDAALASWQWSHPDDPQTAKTPCPPETLSKLLGQRSQPPLHLRRRRPRSRTARRITRLLVAFLAIR